MASHADLADLLEEKRAEAVRVLGGAEPPWHASRGGGPEPPRRALQRLEEADDEQSLESEMEGDQAGSGGFFLTEAAPGAVEEVPSSGPVSTASEDSVLKELLNFQPSEEYGSGEPEAFSALGTALSSARGLVDAPLSPPAVQRS